MIGNRCIGQRIARALCAWVLLFVISAGVRAQEGKGERLEVSGESLLDDYHQHVGLTYNAQAKVQAAYLWRGLYCGAMNVQGSANVGYGGLYVDMWWNIGTEDWTFKHFQPEVDLTLGFSRWGIDIYALYIHNFKHGFFDMAYYDRGRNALEVGARYTVSSKLPLSILWATRFTDADSYVIERVTGDGLPVTDTIHAYSSYAEISYTWHLPSGFSLYGAIGMTPWKSLYTGYQGGAALQNVEVRLRKDWDMGNRCGMMVQGQIAVNPSAAVNVINLNATVGVYLK